MVDYKIVKRVPRHLLGKYMPSQKLGKSYMALQARADGEWEEIGGRYTIKGITDFINSYSGEYNLDICGEVYLDVAFEEWRRNCRKNRRAFKV